ncbi:MAG: hypothetical protein CXR31_03340 [Geobacter sp.]|nr:MAG: hypothetical protein CXR31_03340 [Geobacter sp.]
MVPPQIFTIHVEMWSVLHSNALVSSYRQQQMVLVVPVQTGTHASVAQKAEYRATHRRGVDMATVAWIQLVRFHVTGFRKRD